MWPVQPLDITRHNGARACDDDTSWEGPEQPLLQGHAERGVGDTGEKLSRLVNTRKKLTTKPRVPNLHVVTCGEVEKTALLKPSEKSGQAAARPGGLERVGSQRRSGWTRTEWVGAFGTFLDQVHPALLGAGLSGFMPDAGLD